MELNSLSNLRSEPLNIKDKNLVKCDSNIEFPFGSEEETSE